MRDLIARALMQGADWTVTGGGPGVLTAEERALAARIARGPDVIALTPAVPGRKSDFN